MNSHVRFDHDHRHQIATPRAESAVRPVKTLSSVNLFQGTREIAIEHGESVYRLKITRQGKLILNK
ncbi:MAG: hemin uptake protein HemP [Rhizobiaceae bacterium]